MTPVKIDHEYALSLEWTGNRGVGTADYRSYGRDHVVRSAGKHAIEGSADRPFRGDTDRWNPEELLLAALTQCHLLSYLHVAAVNGIVVVAYTDDSVGTMAQTGDGGGRFTRAVLRPTVTIAEATQRDLALALHARAHELCFIASSVNFPVDHEPTIVVA